MSINAVQKATSFPKHDCLEYLFPSTYAKYFSLPFLVGKTARKLHQQLRQEAAALKIQKNVKRYIAMKSYLTLCSSAITLQAGLRAMDARKEFNFRKRTKAAINIQVSSLVSGINIRTENY